MAKFISFYILIFASLLALGTNKLLADVPESQKPEVRHLLEFVETTGCTFERNGKKYNGERASKHKKESTIILETKSRRLKSL